MIVHFGLDGILPATSLCVYECLSQRKQSGALSILSSVHTRKKRKKKTLLTLSPFFLRNKKIPFDELYVCPTCCYATASSRLCLAR